MMSMGNGTMIGMMVISILIIGFLLYFLIVGITNTIRKKEHTTEGREMQILKERLAQGEINEEEFQQKKELLQK
ncbi:SHOCT domain-containing protein [Sinobaca sp. H24]|uniref:SHOCT domain-containing protein n=1 Tax=Sinobaca sp. H24 TaxID=2923376 RepID=UPI002079801D|nr:SHOCT domain-containing protein [Sinobaca sp. H24]